MAEESNSAKQDYHADHANHREKKSSKGNGGSGILGAAYFMAFIGAAVYYIQQTSTFWQGFLGFLKAIVWPGMLIFDLLKFLNP